MPLHCQCQSDINIVCHVTGTIHEYTQTSFYSPFPSVIISFDSCFRKWESSHQRSILSKALSFGTLHTRGKNLTQYKSSELKTNKQNP